MENAALEILSRQGREDLALLYLGRTHQGSLVEFVESVQPPIPRHEKWVLIVSTLKGCPVRCKFCDAGDDYRGPLSSEEIFEQIEAMVTRRFPDRRVPVPKFKIQFARMGEPTLNNAVLEVLRRLPREYVAPGLMPCISTVLPRGRDVFLLELKEIKDAYYAGGRFQMQFSLHTTDDERRVNLVSFPVLGLAEAGKLGDDFLSPGDRKIALNFAVAKDFPINPEILMHHFDPSTYVIKLTPLNPTDNAHKNHLQTRIDPNNGDGSGEIVASLQAVGYEVILSLGQPEEDLIGTNCGQYVNQYRQRQEIACS